MAAMSALWRVTPLGGGAAEEEPIEVDVTAAGDDGEVRRAVMGSDRSATTSTARTIEVVVDGWRFELVVEEAARAELRARARRDRGGAAKSGPLEIRAMIPGRIAAVAVIAGDSVEIGQTLLVIEAMKMQNELRAPRDGRVDRVSVGVGETIDLGDVLVVLA
jgi:biotin carboxyl carrier protein